MARCRIGDMPLSAPMLTQLVMQGGLHWAYCTPTTEKCQAINRHTVDQVICAAPCPEKDDLTNIFNRLLWLESHPKLGFIDMWHKTCQESARWMKWLTEGVIKGEHLALVFECMARSWYIALATASVYFLSVVVYSTEISRLKIGGLSMPPKMMRFYHRSTWTWLGVQKRIYHQMPRLKKSSGVLGCICVVRREAVAWWRHQMETFSALLAICAGNSPVPGEFPAQRPVTRSFDVLFDLRLNKRLSKQSWGWWF